VFPLEEVDVLPVPVADVLGSVAVADVLPVPEVPVPVLPLAEVEGSLVELEDVLPVPEVLDEPLLVIELEVLFVHVPRTSTLWPTCALRSSELINCTPLGCFLSTSK
jgi:hypothetical protein